MAERVRKTFKYKLMPTPGQDRAMETALACCRELYNAGLEERKAAWEKCGITVNFAMQSAQLPAIKEVRPEYRNLNAQVLQEVLHRLDKAFAAFFRRVKAGEQPGYPRFRGRNRYTSFTYPQVGEHGGAVLDGAILSLSKIGRIPIRLHRPLQGTPKTVTIRHEADGWYACISCAEVPVEPLPLTGRETGIDVGLKVFLVTADGEYIENPRHHRKAEQGLKKAQRCISRRRKGSKRWWKAVGQCATKYRVVARCCAEQTIMTTSRSHRLGRGVVLLALATLISGCGASTTSPGGHTTPTPTPTPFHALVVAAPVLAPSSPATETTLRVLDPMTGQQVWSQMLNGYPGPFSPAVAGGVLASSVGIPGQPYPAAEVAAFNVRTGTALWRKDLPANTQGYVFAAGSSFIMVTAPVSVEAGGTAPGLTIMSLKPDDGSQIWQHALPKLELSGPVMFTDGTVLVSAAQVGSVPVSYLLTALDAASGTQRWQKPIGTGALLNGVGAAGRVYVSMYAGRPIVETRPGGPLMLPMAFALDPTMSPLEGTLTAYRASDGAQLWQAHGFTTVQAVAGSALYATDIAPQSAGGTGMADFTVVAYNAATGAELWRSPGLAAADPFGSKPFAAADAHAAYVFGMPETTPGVHALTGGTGAQLWKALPNTNVYGGVAGLDKVFVATTPSTPPGQHPVMQTTVTLYALDAASGATAWKTTIDDCLGARLVLV